MGVFDNHSLLTKYSMYNGDIKTHFLLPNQRVDVRISELDSNYDVFVHLSGLVKKNESFSLIPTNEKNVFVPNFENSSLRSILEMWNATFQDLNSKKHGCEFV